MKKIQIKGYSYEELSDTAKERAREYYEETILNPEYFTEDCETRLKSLFPNSDLKVTYSLSYSQGDGLSLYGDLSLADCLDKVKTSFTPKEIKFLEWVITDWRSTYIIPCHYRGYYLSFEISGEIMYDMESNYMRNIKEDVLIKFEKLTYQLLKNLCDELEEDGYRFFYEYSDEDVAQEFSESNCYFLENGALIEWWWTEE